MSVLGNDTFTRTNVASGFGTATDGQTWTQIIPTGFAAGTVSVTSNEGVIVNNAVDTIMSLGPTSGDGEVLVRFSINNSGDTLGVQLRTKNASGSVSNYKFLWYGGNVHLNKDVGNTNTQITTNAFSVSLNTFYWMRFRLVGTTCWGKIWADGSAEPAAWIATNTDVSVTGVGTASLLGNTGGGTGVRFDSFYAVDYPLQDTLTPSDSFSSSIAFAPTESVTCTETNAETIVESVTDTALSCSDTISAANPPLTVSFTDTITSSEAISDTLAPTLVDTAITTSDSVIAAITVSYALLDTALTASDTITGTGSTLNLAYNAGWTVLGNDTGTRSNSSGTWGTSTDGQTWSIPTGSATLAVTSNEMTATACTAPTYIKLGSTTSADAEVLVRTSVNNTSSNGNGVFLRQTGSTTAYRCRLNASTPTSTGFGLAKLVANTSTNLTQVTFTESINTFYWIRFRIQGINLYAKTWASGTAEPAAWTVTTTDSSITGAGNFGIYDSGSNTNNIASYDNFYCIDNALADNSVTPPADTIVDSLIFIPTESQTLVESSSNADTFCTVTDTAMSTTETASYTEVFIGAEQSIANLDNYIPGDSLTYGNSVVGIVQVDSLTCSDSASFTQVFVPSEILTETEVYTTTLATNIFFSWQETVTISDILVPTLQNLISDTLTSAETATFLEAFSLLDVTISASDSVALVVGKNVTDSLSCTETSSSTIAFSGIDTDPIVSDSLFSTRPVSFTDDVLNTSDSFTIVLLLSDSWQGTLSDVKLSLEVYSPTDTITSVELPTYTEILAKTDVALSISDSLLSGVPSNFTADTLTIAESIVITGSTPALLFTDQLSTLDTLFVLDNFTDFCFVVESYLTTVSSNTLDPRSNLYATIIADNPTVYYQMNEGQFNGIFQRDGQDNVNNASNPTIIGALLSYTWAQLEPSVGIYNWSLIDSDILPWANQAKNIVLRVYTASTLADNDITHFAMTASQATPSWVFSAGAPMVTGFDSVVYPVYWDLVYQAKYAAFIKQFALRYDTNPYVRGIVVGAGVDGSTSLERSGDTPTNTLALWGPRGYSNDTWASAIHWVTAQYSKSFARTGMLLSINNAFIVPDNVYNITYCLDVAVQHAVWALDENASVNNLHTGQQWDIVTLATIAPAPTSVTGSTVSQDLAVAINEQSDYAAVWASDVTAPSNQAALTTYAAKATQRYLHDISPLQKSVTVSGAVYPSSRIITGDYLNGAQQFDGFTGYAMMTQSFQGDTSKWTLKASFYPTILPTQSIIVANGQDGVAAFGGYAMGIAAGASGGFGQNLCAYIPGYGWYDSGYMLPAVNTWYNVFMVFDGTLLTFYVNGVQTANVNVITPYAMQPRATMGMIWDAVQLKKLYYFTGSIDEIAVYPTALTSTRIAAISAAEMGLSDVKSNNSSFFTAQDIALVVSDSASMITVSQSFTENLTVSDIFAQSSINVAYLGETILINDFFNRSNQAGWGVATDGQIWTQPVNNGTLSIVGNQGQITSMSGANVMFLGSSSAALVDGRVHVTMQSGTDATVGVILRATDATHYYIARLNATNFGIVKVNGGTTTNILDVAFTPSGGAGYWIRFRAVGSLLMAKYWIDTASEPNSYSSIGTDSSYTTGQMGLYASTTNGADIYTFSNFFAVDNYMTDFIPVGEVYSTTEILPPFTEFVNETEVTLIVGSEINLDISVTEVETVVYNTIMLDTDALTISASVQAWSVSFVPIEILTINEALLSNSPTPLASDVLVLTDVSTITNQPVVVDVVSAPTDSVAEALTFLPTDVLTMQEIGIDSLANLSGVDLFFINEFPVYTDGNLLNDSVTTTDLLGFTEIFVPVDQASSVDASTTTNIFLLIDTAPTTSDVIRNTPIFINTEVVYGDASLDDFSSMFTLAVTILDVTVTALDVIIPNDTINIIDVTVTTSDVIVPTDIPVLVDIITSSDAVFVTMTQALSDSMTVIEILLSSSPANITDVTVTTSDVITPTNRPVLVDVSTSNDTIISSNLSSLSDSLSCSDVIVPNDNFLLNDTANSSDIFNNAFVVSFTDINIQTTDYLFTPIMENTADPTLTALELTLALAVASNLIDTPTVQEILVSTNIFLLPDVVILPGTELIIESLTVMFPNDSQTELESLLLTDIPQGLTDQMVTSDAFIATVNPVPVDNLVSAEINSVQIVVQNIELFNETEVNLFALVTSLTADQLTETNSLMSSLLESDLATLIINDVSTVTNNPTGTDTVSIISDIVVEGDIFVPIDPMTSQEIIIAAEAYSALDSVVNTEINIVTNIAVPIDMTPVQDLLIAETSIEILIDTPVLTDLSTMQAAFVPSDALTESDIITFALVASLQDVASLVDASTTTVNNKNTDVLTIAVSTQSWIISFVPYDVVPFIDASTTKTTQFQLDTLSAQDNVPILGYGLIDTPLNSSEAITASAKTFVLVTGVIPSGTVKGIITNALITGTIYSGEIQGVIP